MPAAIQGETLCIYIYIKMIINTGKCNPKYQYCCKLLNVVLKSNLHLYVLIADYRNVNEKAISAKLGNVAGSTDELNEPHGTSV